MSEQSSGGPTSTPPAAPPQLSPDGRWWWDGTRWVAVAAQPAPTIPSGSAGPAFADPAGRARVATVMLALAGLAAIFNVITDLVQILAVGSQGLSGPNEYRLDDFLQGLAALAYLTALILGAVFFLRWEHRVARNVRALGATGLRYTPGWTVGWWFVPFANLVLPYRVAAELWTASANDGSTVPGYVRVWWALWIAGGLVSNVAARLSVSATSTAGVQTGDLIDLVAVVLLAVAAALAIRLVGELTSRQQATAYAYTGTARPPA